MKTYSVPHLGQVSWANLVSLLSLDGVLPFYSSMGLPSVFDASFLNVIRKVIGEVRAAAEKGQVGSSTGDLTFNAVEREFGIPAAEAFHLWVLNVWHEHHVESVDWSAWEICFSQWKAAMLPDDKAIASIWEPLINAFRREVKDSKLEELLERMQSAPLSVWDAKIYIRRNWGSKSSNPFDRVWSLSTRHRFHHFWLSHMEKQTPDVLCRMTALAQGVLNQLNVWMPRDLALPKFIK